MTGRRILALAAAGALGACTPPDSARDRGEPPPIEASLLRQDAFLTLAGRRLPEVERETLGRALRLVALGRPEAVRATVTAPPAEAKAVRAALLALGMDSARIDEAAVQDHASPLTAQVSLFRYVVHLRDCGAAIQPATDPGIDVASSLDSLGRCAQANNLARMLADPGDLLASPPLDRQPAVVAGGAILRGRAQLGVSGFLPGTAGTAPSTAGPGAPGAAEGGDGAP